MDPQEAKLEEEVRQCRAELLSRGESLRRTVAVTLDPREMFKRHPVRGLLTSLGVGLFAGRMLSGRGGRVKNGASEPEPSSAAAPSFASLAMGMILPRILPALVGPVLGFFQRERPPDKADNGRARSTPTSGKR